MEFDHVGAKCALPTCHQHDFLPFHCAGCGKSYCLDHRTAEQHQCKGSPIENFEIPTCPLCSQPVPMSRGDDPNVAVNRHISRGCPSSKHHSGTCHVRGCSASELVPVFCKQCGQRVCLKHRHPDAHQCAGQRAAQQRAAEQRAAQQRRQQQLQQQRQQHQQQQQQRRAQVQAARRPRTAREQRVALTKLRMRAKGAGSVPKESRFYLDVHTASRKMPQQPMYFHRTHTIGRCIDAIAKAAGVVNRNNKPGADRLVLFLGDSPEPLPSECPLHLLLQDGDAVRLGVVKAS